MKLKKPSMREEVEEPGESAAEEAAESPSQEASEEGGETADSVPLGTNLIKAPRKVRRLARARKGAGLSSVPYPKSR